MRGTHTEEKEQEGKRKENVEQERGLRMQEERRKRRQKRRLLRKEVGSGE